jgi:hypothetical protein
MTELSVAVDRHEIVVSKPSSGFSVTYRRTGRVLVALDPMRNDPAPEELIFLVRAWKAAFAKAQSLGWLNWADAGQSQSRCHQRSTESGSELSGLVLCCASGLAQAIKFIPSGRIMKPLPRLFVSFLEP